MTRSALHFPVPLRRGGPSQKLRGGSDRRGTAAPDRRRSCRRRWLRRSSAVRRGRQRPGPFTARKTCSAGMSISTGTCGSWRWSAALRRRAGPSLGICRGCQLLNFAFGGDPLPGSAHRRAPPGPGRGGRHPRYAHCAGLVPGGALRAFGPGHHGPSPGGGAAWPPVSGRSSGRRTAWWRPSSTKRAPSSACSGTRERQLVSPRRPARAEGGAVFSYFRALCEGRM